MDRSGGLRCSLFVGSVGGWLRRRHEGHQGDCEPIPGCVCSLWRSDPHPAHRVGGTHILIRFRAIRLHQSGGGVIWARQSRHPVSGQSADLGIGHPDDCCLVPIETGRTPTWSCEVAARAERGPPCLDRSGKWSQGTTDHGLDASGRRIRDAARQGTVARRRRCRGVLDGGNARYPGLSR